MSDLTRQDVESAVAAVLERRKGIDEKTHSAHHQFIEEEITRRKIRRARIQKIQDQVAGTITLGFVLFALAAVGAAIRAWFKGEPQL